MVDGAKVMIVGGAGAVGNQLVSALNPRSLIVVDRAEASNKSDRIQYLKCDLSDWQDVKALSHLGFKALRVVYLAANLDQCDDIENVPSVLSDNVLAFGNFLSAFAGSMDHLIYLSSVSVYGHPENNPIDENHPTRPDSIYGISKLSAEMIARSLCARHNIGLTIIRASQLFGLPSAESSLPACKD
jgi:UDP-glucose 4-epimerase